ELGLDLPSGHAQNDAVESDVFATRELGVKARPDLDERAEPAPHHKGAASGDGDAGQDLEKGALPRAVQPYQPEHLAALERKGDVAERPEFFPGRHRPAQEARREAAHLILDRGDIPAAAQPVAL